MRAGLLKLRSRAVTPQHPARCDPILGRGHGVSGQPSSEASTNEVFRLRGFLENHLKLLTFLKRSELAPVGKGSGFAL